MDDIDRFLKEDLGDIGDITSDALLGDEEARGFIVAREPCVVAGLAEAEEVFSRCGATMRKLVDDGVRIEGDTRVAIVDGSAKSILKAERLALNFLGRMSGIATLTRILVEVCRSVNPSVSVAATRKTTPGFRFYEKKAVVLGGGERHRMGLYDAVLIKDNHIRCVGSIEEAIKRVQRNLPDKPIEIEVESREEALKAARMGVDTIMLDNFSPMEGRVVAEEIRRINSNVRIEVSGGITPDNISLYAKFADRVSLGYITHSARSIDFSLELEGFERNV